MISCLISVLLANMSNIHPFFEGVPWHDCCYITDSTSTTNQGDLKMKTVLSSIVAALVALSFAGIVCAADPAPAMPAGHPAVAAPAADAAKDAKPAKKAKKTKKTKKPAADAAAPAAAPAAK
jgi:hypothetical protein